jgi:hypothetical protein
MVPASSGRSIDRSPLNTRHFEVRAEPLPWVKVCEGTRHSLDVRAARKFRVRALTRCETVALSSRGERCYPESFSPGGSGDKNDAVRQR